MSHIGADAGDVLVVSHNVEYALGDSGHARAKDLAALAQVLTPKLGRHVAAGGGRRRGAGEAERLALVWGERGRLE